MRIPAAIAKQMDIEEGSEIEFRIEGKRLVVERAADLPKFSHEDLMKALRKVKAELVDLGRPRGKEVL